MGHRMGSAGDTAQSPGAPVGLGPGHWDSLSPPRKSYVKSRVLPPEQQHSEKPLNQIKVMQARVGGWYWIPLRAPAGWQHAGLS